MFSSYDMHSAVLAIDQNGALPYSKICTCGVMAMLAHLLVFFVAVQQLSDIAHMLMTVASALFFVETGAFLLVVTAFRREVVSPHIEPLNRDNLC